MKSLSTHFHAELPSTPVASIATCVHPCAVSHWPRSNSPRVFADTVRCSYVTVAFTAMRTGTRSHCLRGHPNRHTGDTGLPSHASSW